MPTHQGRTGPNSALLGWISFAAFLPIGMLLGAWALLHYMPRQLMDRPLSGASALIVCVASVVAIGLLAYLVAWLWLVVARYFFSRNVLAKIIFSGPATRLDRWLFDWLCPK